MKADLVFSGCGICGIAFIGAMRALEEQKYQIARCAGVSSGAFFASLIAAGFSSDELFDICRTTEFKTFKHKTSLGKIPVIGDGLSLISNLGIYDADYLENWLNKLFSKKNKTHFNNLMGKDGYKLKVIAADITKREMLIIPDNLPSYGINPKNFETARAVKYSINLPYFYSKQKLYYNNNKNYSQIVDGGILSIFPIWIFDVKSTPRWPTFGFKVGSEKPNNNNNNNNEHDLYNYTVNIVETMINSSEEIYVRDKDKVRTISINNFGLKGTDYEISKDMFDKLIDEGYTKTKEFLNSWNFDRYVSEYRR